jgi:taurine dioxygenase
MVATRSSVPYEPLVPFGALVDLDAGDALDEATAEGLRHLFQTHYLLLFRDQTLDPAQNRRLMEVFGPVPEEDDPLVSNDPEVGLQGDGRLAFHSDLAFAPEPDLGLSLYALDLVPDTSTTVFANGVLAYVRLPPSLKDRLEGLRALSVWPLDQSRRNRLVEENANLPRCEHPVVWDHPDTGEPVLYLTEMQTDSIVGLPEDESEALIEELFGHLYAGENLYTHSWRNGDLAIIDNRALQHSRPDVSGVGRRTLRRTTLARQTFFEQFPQFKPVDGFATAVDTD